jgi:general secretion pathway protein J
MRATPARTRADLSAQGFTLMEVLVSMAIIAGMMTLIWGSFSLTVRSKRRVEEIEARYHQIRLAMNRMAREISMAYLSKNDHPGAQAMQKPRTKFIAQRNSKVDELSFSSLAHVPLRENAKECDQSLIMYYAAPDPEDRSMTNLMRRETRRLLDPQQSEEDAPAYIMLEDIEELHFEFFDEQNNEWREDWSTISLDGQPERLPSKIRISLIMRDEMDRETTYVTATRIFLQDALWFTSGS